MDKEDRVCLRFSFDDNWRIALLSCFIIIIIIFFFLRGYQLKTFTESIYRASYVGFLYSVLRCNELRVVNRRALFEELKWWFLRQTIICRQHILTFRKVQRDIDNKFVFLFWPETSWVKETSEKVVDKQAKRFLK